MSELAKNQSSQLAQDNEVALNANQADLSAAQVALAAIQAECDLLDGRISVLEGLPHPGPGARYDGTINHNNDIVAFTASAAGVMSLYGTVTATAGPHGGENPLRSDVTFEVSVDGGASWTTLVNSDIGDPDTAITWNLGHTFDNVQVGDVRIRLNVTAGTDNPAAVGTYHILFAPAS
jgi:hypothetical protein